MENSNLTIRSLWIGKELSPLEILCIKSYLHNGHSLELYVYDRIDNLPQGVMLQDASLVVPQSEVFAISLGKHKNGFTTFANYFRYKLLYGIGGWWSDLDAVCLKPYDFEQEYVFMQERTRNQKEKIKINNGVIKSPKSAPIMKYCYETAEQKFRNKADLVWGETGPALLTEAVSKFELSQYAVAPDFFAPYTYFEIYKIFSDVNLPDCSYSLHLYNSTWTAQNYPKYGYFRKYSLFEILKERFGVKNSLPRFARELLVDLKNKGFRSGMEAVGRKIKYGYHIR